VQLEGPLDSAVSQDLADDVLAVLREAISNAKRHGGASVIGVALRLSGGQLSLEVTDDGVGMPDDPPRSGLANLADRASLHGGSFVAERRPEGGTRVLWTAPQRAALG
jgi:signal transduction histidine kinase